MENTGKAAATFKVNNIRPAISRENKERLEKEALRTMHEIYSKQEKNKKI